MSRWAKVGIVLGGYVAAFIASIVAGWLYNWRVSKLPYDTSGGMYAGGEMIQSLAAFFLVALVPTVLALWFLRGNDRFWNTVAGAALVFAVVGLFAVVSPMVIPERVGVMLFLSLIAVMHLLGAPLWFLSFGVFALLAPTRATRRKMTLAVIIEGVTGICCLIHWLVPRPPF
jgi:hypothetical protein